MEECKWIRGYYDGMEQDDENTFSAGCDPDLIVEEDLCSPKLFKYCPACSKPIILVGE